MKSVRLSPAFVVGACVVGIVAALGIRAVQGADDASPKAVAQIKDVMIAVNGEGALVPQIGDALKKGALSDDDWEAVGARAAMVAEAGNILLALKPPLGAGTPEGLAAWKKHVLDYRGCAEALHDAAGKKDAAVAATALGGLRKRCAECHKDHKPKE